MLQNGADAISAGQRQRIMIARALVADHPIWLMDESTASLDVRTSMDVERTLAPLIKERTVLFSSHRDDSLIAADRSIRLGDAHE